MCFIFCYLLQIFLATPPYPSWHSCIAFESSCSWNLCSVMKLKLLLISEGFFPSTNCSVPAWNIVGWYMCSFWTMIFPALRRKLSNLRKNSSAVWVIRMQSDTLLAFLRHWVIQDLRSLVVFIGRIHKLYCCPRREFPYKKVADLFLRQTIQAKFCKHSSLRSFAIVFFFPRIYH